MQEHTLAFVKGIDAAAPSYEKAISGLRQLSLDEFGEVLSALPSDQFPNISTLLPSQTPDSIQQMWTGNTGDALLTQSLYFVNTLVTNYVTEVGRSIEHADVLDFGCGWGRLLRLMLYYCDTNKLFGCDAWDGSLVHARAANIPVTLARSEASPSELPFPGQAFDLIYAFSVFTHLPEAKAQACLAAIRKHMKPDGLLVATVRPVEFWTAANQPSLSGADPSLLAERHRKEGFAFHPAKSDPTWGDASISREYLSRLPGWRVVRMGRSLVDPYQIVVSLRPS